MKIDGGSLVILCGVSGSGKSHWAEEHFRPPEILSSDAFRERLADDEDDQTVSRDAFYLMRWIALRRLKRGLTTVIDSTALSPLARRKWRRLAREAGCPAVLVAFDVPEAMCVANNHGRRRNVGKAVIRTQRTMFDRALATIWREGYDTVAVMSAEEACDVQVLRDAIRR